MSETLPENQSPSNNPNGEGKVDYNSIVGPVGAGVLLGGISFGIASALTDQSHAEGWGYGMGFATSVAGLGVQLGKHSLDRAETASERGDIIGARVNVLRAIMESGLGVALALSTPGVESRNLMEALILAGMGGLVGGSSAFLDYKERTKPLPELIFPEGIYRDLNYPDRYQGTKLPPVFVCSDLSTLKQFRAENKEEILKWAGPLSVEGVSNRPSALSKRLETIIAILPNIDHYPALDPQGSTKDITIRDGKGDKIIVSPLEQSRSNYWAYDTSFEGESMKGIKTSKQFDAELWKASMEESWKGLVVLLIQYQDPTYNKLTHTDTNPANVIDKYWLIDRQGEDQRGRRRRMEEPVKKARRASIFNFNPNQI